MESNLKSLTVNESIFKRLKKKKRTILITNDKSKFEELDNVSKIRIVNDQTKKDIIRKIDKIIKEKDIKSLKDKLGKKEKYIYTINNIEEDKEVYGIEFKYNRKIIRKVLLTLILLVMIFLAINSIKISIDYAKSKKFKSEINNIASSRVNYVIVEINPRAILEIKNDKVVSFGCLNDDCKEIFKDIDVINKPLDETVDIFYNKAKGSGVDVSKGVKVLSQDEDVIKSVKKKDYVEFEKIDNKREQDYINEVIDNDAIKKQTAKKDYNELLLETYKKDSDYNKLYTCKITNNKLSCYITDDFFEDLSLDDSNMSYDEYLPALINSITTVNPKLVRLLDKFNIKHYSDGVEGLNYEIVAGLYLKVKEYQISQGGCVQSNTISMSGGSTGEEKCYNKASLDLGNYDENPFGDFKMIYLPFNKVDLYNQEIDTKDAVILKD